MLQMFVIILTAGWYGPACPVQLYQPLLLLWSVASATDSTDGWILLSNKYECWSGASVSDMHACRHKFTDMTTG